MHTAISATVRAVANGLDLALLHADLESQTFSDHCSIDLFGDQIYLRCEKARGGVLAPVADLGPANRLWIREALAERVAATEKYRSRA